MSIQDRAREFWRQATDNGTAAYSSQTLMAEFATLERKAAVQSERAKIADELEDVMRISTDWAEMGEGLRNYIEKLRGKSLDG